jgi:DNA-binding CsgD family transcriptional regulator
VVRELLHLARDQDHPWGLATAKRGAAQVGLARADEHVDAHTARLVEAASAFADLGLDFDRARSLLSLGVVQRRLKKRGAARTSLAEAAAGFARCGSSGWAEQARQELDRVSGRRRVVDGQLTATEERVAGLAAGGLSNKEIAERLFVTVNTVEGHLSRVYAKLGVRSRRQLQEHLAPAGNP